MKKRRTMLIVQQGLCGLAIQRGHTAILLTCPQTAAALGVSLRWVHRYVRGRKRGALYQLGRPLLWRAEVRHLQRWLDSRRRALPRQQSIHSKGHQRRPWR
jgi:hypothetical protein